MNIKKLFKKLILFVILMAISVNIPFISYASERDQQLYQTALPYIKYFLDRSLDQSSSFQGFTRSFQLSLGGNTPADEAVISYGASSYDQTIIGRICLAGGNTAVLDTFVAYFKQLSYANNPVFNCNGNYYDGAGGPLNYGSYRIIRILGRDIPNWWTTWDWIVDTGAAACVIVDAAEGYQKLNNTDYKNLAVLLGDYLLKLQDADGGIRYGPRGMYHYPEGISDFYWNLKSSEQNERILYAFEALFEITGDVKYSQAAAQIRNWLKGMYDPAVHLYHSAATFNGTTWTKADFGYVATDVTAFAPFDMMFQDAYFGSTQQQRDTEVDALFAAIEARTAFLNSDGKPIFFRFSISQTGDYGSVEMSSQMALAYLKVAQIYSARGEEIKTKEYLDKYNILVTSLENYFSVPSDDPAAKIAPYASFVDGRVAGGVPTGTGYYTLNCQGAVASAYYVFAKSGYLPFKLGGGTGIPATGCTLNMANVPWYQNTVYSSTGAAVSEMILNYIREGAGQPLLTQDEIYTYARLPGIFGGDLSADEVDKVLGHFDPYDYLVSNWSNGYDSSLDGNPYKGYNFSVDAYDPRLNPNAMNEFMRDICHWMAYTVTKEDWWKDGELVARPNTPAAIPIYGTYNHWIAVKGYATSAPPTPAAHTNPFYTPDFTVYGFWIKDPFISGIGKDTYKTAAECASTYFLPLSTSDAYNGMFVQVAEPPARVSHANVLISKPSKDLANLEFIGIDMKQENQNSLFQTAAQNTVSTPMSKSYVRKQNWRDIVDAHLLSDPNAIAAFEGTKAGRAVLVKRQDAKDSDYYLVPFGKHYKRGGFLITGVIILDADDGHFKEAGWTEKPERFLKIKRNSAVSLVRRYVFSNYRAAIRKLHANLKKTNAVQNSSSYFDYKKLCGYLDKAKAELVWQPNNYSSSPYTPYWRVDAHGYIWYVTQDGSVTAETGFEKMLDDIRNNSIAWKKFFKTQK